MPYFPTRLKGVDRHSQLCTREATHQTMIEQKICKYAKWAIFIIIEVCKIK
jgi:hypothetical protein